MTNPQASSSKKNKKILVIRFSALGDIAMTVPVIREFAKQNPNANITMLSIPFIKPLFEEIPNVTFWEADIKGKYKGLKGLIKLSKELKAEGFDDIADLHNSIRSRIIRYLLKSSVKNTAVIFKDRPGRKALTRIKDKVFEPLISMQECYCEVFEKLGYTRPNLSEPEFPTKKELEPSLAALLGEKRGAWVGVSPFSQIASKEYPLDLLEKSLLLCLEKNADVKFLFFGGKNDIEVLDKFEKSIPNSINISKHIRFKQEINLVPYLDLMLSMDSFNGHFASVYGVAVVTLWGPTHPFAGFKPFNQPIANQLIPDLEKYPALPSCTHGKKVAQGCEEAMKSIEPDQVADKILEVLNRSPRLSQNL